MFTYYYKILIISILSFVFQYNLFSQSDLKGSLLIKSEDKIAISDLQKSINSKIKLTSIFPELGLYKIEFDENKLSKSQLKALLINKSKGLIIKEDYILEPRKKPNDPKYKEQYNLQKINAEKAWNFTTGGKNYNGSEVVVAIVDLGYDLSNNDFGTNIYKNTKEIGRNNVDDDNNGYIDDVSTLNIITKNGDPNNMLSHGSEVASVIGAQGNNSLGITGIAWNTKLLLFSSANRVALTSLIDGFNYIYQQRKEYNNTNGAKGLYIVVCNASLGVPEKFEADIPEICEVIDLLGSVGIMSFFSAPNENVNVDVVGDMPILCTTNSLIAVSSTDQADQFANRGYGVSVDVASPGEGILVLDRDQNFTTSDGTSLATPLAAGAYSLAYSLPCKKLYDKSLSQPQAFMAELKNIFLQSVDTLAVLKDKVNTSGRINVGKYIESVVNSYCDATNTDFKMKEISPNPTSDFVNIKYEIENTENHTMQIFNVSGKLLHEETVTPSLFSQNSLKVNLKDYPSGIYFITIINKSKKLNAKVIKI